MVLIVARKYIDQNVGDARNELEDLGMQVNEQDGDPASADDGTTEGTVQGVSPVGPVKKGKTITLTVYTKAEEDGDDGGGDSSSSPRPDGARPARNSAESGD